MSHFTVGVIVPSDVNVNDEGELMAKLGELLSPYDENRSMPKYKSYIDADTEERLVKHSVIDEWVESFSDQETKDIFSKLFDINSKTKVQFEHYNNSWEISSGDISLESIRDNYSTIGGKPYITYDSELIIEGGVLCKRDKKSKEINYRYNDAEIGVYKIKAMQFMIKQSLIIMETSKGNEFVLDNGGALLMKEVLIDTVEEYYGAESGIDENGLYYMSSYNPDSKWDYWVVGGRWHGLLSNPSVEKNINNYTTCDTCQGSGKSEDMSSDKCVNCNGEGVVLKDFSEWEEKKVDITSIAVAKEIIEQRGLSFFALITPDGKWLEKGEMGWWAIVSYDDKDVPKKEDYPQTNEGEKLWAEDYRKFKKKKSNEWDESVANVINKYPDDYSIVVVDCHI